MNPNNPIWKFILATHFGPVGPSAVSRDPIVQVAIDYESQLQVYCLGMFHMIDEFCINPSNKSSLPGLNSWSGHL